MKDINIIKILDTFAKITNKLWIGKEELTAVDAATTMCILAKNSNNIFDFEFGTHDSKQFSIAINMFEKCDLVFDDPYIIIKDSNKKNKNFKYKIASAEVMENTIEKNQNALKFFSGIDNSIKEIPHVKTKFSSNLIKEMQSVANTYRLDTLMFEYDGENNLTITIKDKNKKESEWSDFIEVEGKCSNFSCCLESKFLIDGEWDVYFFENESYIYLENELFKVAISYSD